MESVDPNDQLLCNLKDCAAPEVCPAQTPLSGVPPARARHLRGVGAPVQRSCAPPRPTPTPPLLQALQRRWASSLPPFREGQRYRGQSGPFWACAKAESRKPNGLWRQVVFSLSEEVSPPGCLWWVSLLFVSGALSRGSCSGRWLQLPAYLSGGCWTVRSWVSSMSLSRSSGNFPTSEFLKK